MPSWSLPRSLDDPPERDATRAPPGVLDAHVHVFPARLHAAIRRWFDAHAWTIRYAFDGEQVDAFLAARGVEAYLALHYPHEPGMAEALNAFALAFAREHPRAIPCASVLPGEDGAEQILARALDAGARAVKIHAHVQCVGPDDPRMEPVYRQVEAHDALLVYHCGNEPATEGYRCDVRAICSAAAFDRAMHRHPEMKICVPHFGAGETEQYVALLDRYPRLYLDTAMGLSGYLPFALPEDLLAARWDRILYGSDFPNLPYAWDRDLRAIEAAALTGAQRAAILGGTARKLLGA